MKIHFQSTLLQGPLLYLIHGTTALFLGIGLARFSITPVIPLLVRDDWYSAAHAQMQGAWGLAGYLIGCFSAQWLARHLRTNLLTAFLAALVVLSFWFCSFPIAHQFAVFWRLCAGFAGAVLMIVCVAEASRHLISIGHGDKTGILFAGVGAGAVVSALLMPTLAYAPVERVSMTLTLIAAISFLIQFISGFFIQNTSMSQISPLPSRSSPRREKAIFWILAAYGMDALGGTPIAVYFVDYATRQIGIPALWSGIAWAAFGFGAIAGPLIMARKNSIWLIASFFLKALALLVLSISSAPFGYVLACFTCGFFTPGIAVQIANFTRGATGKSGDFLRYWAWATTTFAIMQTASGFGATYLSQLFDNYRPVYALCVIALLFGLYCCWFGRRQLAIARIEETQKMNDAKSRFFNVWHDTCDTLFKAVF